MTQETHLDELEASGMVRLAAIQPELEYLFRHWLVQEAAYGSLLKQERKRLHLMAGEILEQLYPDRLGELAPQLAEHFEQGGDDAKALDYLVKAGRNALEHTAYHEARAFLDRAAERLANAGDDEPTRRRRVRVALGRVQSGWTFTPPPESSAILDAVLPVALALGDDRLLVDVYTWSALARQFSGEQPATSPALKQALDGAAEIAERLGDESIQAQPMSLTGMALVGAGELRRGAELLQRAVPMLEARNMAIAASFATGALSFAYGMLGEYDRAEEEAQRGIDMAVEGDPIARIDARLSQGFVAVMTGNSELAMEIANECEAKSDELGAYACNVASRFLMGRAHLMKDELDQARTVLESGAQLSKISYPAFTPGLLAYLGVANAGMGEQENAIANLTEAIAGARKIGDKAVLARALLARGRATGARPDFEEAVKLYEEMDAKPDLARAREALAALAG